MPKGGIKKGFRYAKRRPRKPGRKKKGVKK